MISVIFVSVIVIVVMFLCFPTSCADGHTKPAAEVVQKEMDAIDEEELANLIIEEEKLANPTIDNEDKEM